MRHRQTRLWDPLWDNVTMRFFADDPAAAGGDNPGGGGGASSPTAKPERAAPAAPAGFDIGNVFNSDGTFADGYHEHVKDVVDGSSLDKIKDFKGLMKSWSNAQRLVGRKLQPKDDAPDEEWDTYLSGLPVWKVPEKAEDYDLSIEGVEDKVFAENLERTGYLKQVQDTLKAAGIPARLAPKLATAILQNMQDKWDAFHSSAKEIREKTVEPFLGKVKYDDAAKNGRAALARLMNHTEDKPSELMTSWLKLMDDNRLADHPLTVAILHQLATRMNPARAFVTGGDRAKNPNTGPGVVQQGGYARAMAPLTARQAGITD